LNLSIPDPGSRIADPRSRIPDPTTATKKEEEKMCCPTFVVATREHKIGNYLSFEQVKKKI
jgi:hypothetical protein